MANPVPSLDPNFDRWANPIERALRRYVYQVAEAVGVGPEATCCEASSVTTAYIALDDWRPGFPARDVALIWDDTHGWAVAIETRSGEDLVVLDYSGPDALPDPESVADFARTVLARERQVRVPVPPDFTPAEVRARLAEEIPAPRLATGR